MLKEQYSFFNIIVALFMTFVYISTYMAHEFSDQWKEPRTHRVIAKCRKSEWRLFKAYLAFQGKTVTDWFDEQLARVRTKLEKQN
jgi:phosphatidylglycerophosphate synthase